MKKLFLIIFATLNFIAMTSAQTEKVGYKSVSAKFEQFYNAEKPDSIFSMFSN